MHIVKQYLPCSLLRIVILSLNSPLRSCSENVKACSTTFYYQRCYQNGWCMFSVYKISKRDDMWFVCMVCNTIITIKGKDSITEATQPSNYVLNHDMMKIKTKVKIFVSCMFITGLTYNLSNSIQRSSLLKERGENRNGPICRILAMYRFIHQCIHNIGILQIGPVGHFTV